MRRFRAFTLIELLIVVAIIAILAAIAVPNFLEAQTRAKVSRILADMRSMKTGIESYRIDNNRYHPSIDPSTSATWVPRIRTFTFLTTPVAYLTSAFADVFNTMEPAPPGFSESDQHVIIYWGPDILIQAPNGTDLRDRTALIFQEFPTITNGTTLNRDSIYALLSYSPDQDFDVLDEGWPTPIQAYDATNGTLSDGDIVTFND
ncbi:prepilin-type N-terminal cleavage/methylation domain-containing protein [Candidatus Sumerlaeota bacterium]|nr:prepilin-type N-terminal cleavage/methylation domain-containing protein [Candidatus Sumerlaeota bacterium]